MAKSTETPRREQRAEAIAKATVEDGPGHEYNERLRVPKEVSSVIQNSPSDS